MRETTIGNVRPGAASTLVVALVFALSAACAPKFNKPANQRKASPTDVSGISPSSTPVPEQRFQTVFNPQAVGGLAQGTSQSFRVTGAAGGVARNQVGTSAGFRVTPGIAGQGVK